MQGLLEIFVFEKRILGEDCRPIWVCSKQLQDPADGDSHTTDARLPAALPRLNRNPIEQVYCSRGTSLEHPGLGELAMVAVKWGYIRLTAGTGLRRSTSTVTPCFAPNINGCGL